MKHIAKKIVELGRANDDGTNKTWMMVINMAGTIFMNRDVDEMQAIKMAIHWGNTMVDLREAVAAEDTGIIVPSPS